MSGADQVCVAEITGAHGVRGLVKLKSYTEDAAAAGSYGPVSTEDGVRSFELRLLSRQRDQWIARLDSIGTREAAEALAGVRLYIPRSRLPEAEEDEFYHADLIGLPVEIQDGEHLGTVVGVHNFGAGDLVEIRRGDGSTVMVPFTRAVVPIVDFAGRRMVIDPPTGLLDAPEAAA